MNIYGLQKTTLLDYPGRVACTVFTGGCSFKCPFCHNASLVYKTADIIDSDKITDFLIKRSGILDGICISGGEPLMSDDIFDFIRFAHGLGYSIKLDTNGCFPSALKRLVSEGLIDYVAMDFKNSPRRYAETVGLSSLDMSPIYESADFLMSGAVDYEFRTTVVSELHDAASMRELAERLAGAKRYFLQSFVDSGDIIGKKTKNLSAVSDDTLEVFLEIVREYIPNAQIRGH